MRTFRERLMHTVLFELVLLLICMPVISVIFNKSMSHAGTMSLALSLIAMVCNYIYNYIGDASPLEFIIKPNGKYDEKQ